MTEGQQLLQAGWLMAAASAEAILAPPLPDGHKDQDEEQDREGAERRGGEGGVQEGDSRHRVASQKGGFATQQLKRGPALSQQANPT